MRKIFLTCIIFVGGFVLGQETIKEAQKGVEYGAGVPENRMNNIYDTDQLVKALEHKKEIERVTVKGKATAVCAKKGCWITLENTQKLNVFVKMKDYAFFLPQNIVGKTILLDTKATKKITSVEELRHYAEDAKKSKQEIAKITQPKIEIRLLANGIKVID